MSQQEQDSTGRCVGCRFWDRSEAASDYRPFTEPGEKDFLTWGRCELAKNDNQPDEDGDKKQSPHPESLSLAQDAEGWAAWLLTAPEFGCVQWKPRDQPVCPICLDSGWVKGGPYCSCPLGQARAAESEARRR